MFDKVYYVQTTMCLNDFVYYIHTAMHLNDLSHRWDKTISSKSNEIYQQRAYYTKLKIKNKKFVSKTYNRTNTNLQNQFKPI